VATVRIFKHYVRVPILLLGVVEALVFVAAMYAGAYLRFTGDGFSVAEHVGPIWPRAVVFSAIMIFSMMAVGLYQARLREGLTGFMLRFAASFAVAVTGLSVVFYLFPSLHLWRGTLALVFAVSYAVVAVLRIVFYTVAHDQFKRRILVLGAGQRASSITELRRKSDQHGFTIVGFVHLHGEADVVEPARVLRIDMPLRDYAMEHDIDEIVVAMDDRRKRFPLHDLLDCRMSGIDIVDVMTFFERETGKVRLDMLHPSWLVFSDGFEQGVARMFVKRAFDLGASLLLLALMWPVMLLTALCIMIESGPRAPILYRQVRVGEDGKPFQVLKFRSMRVDAEKSGAQWAQENDSRITRVGRVIRKLRIDEMPQVINVWRGDMSFVGPRPERPEFVIQLSENIPYYSERHRAKPGITGWAQLLYPYGASEKDAVEKLQYDLYYVKNHSLMLDLLILVQTAEVVLWGRGAR